LARAACTLLDAVVSMGWDDAERRSLVALFRMKRLLMAILIVIVGC
jgi:hypothetical protein